MGRKAKSKLQSTKGSRKGGHESGSKAQAARDRTGVSTHVSILHEIFHDEENIDKYVDHCVASQERFSTNTHTIRSALSATIPQPFRCLYGLRGNGFE